MRPDLLVVAAYGQILSKEVLSVPRLGAINVHASLLPKYRGAAPVAYAILNGETQTGVTIIKITPGLDSGDMILQESLDILPDDTTGTLELRLAVLGARLAVEAVRKYQAGGPVEGKKQDPVHVTKAPKIRKEQGLIDWSQPAESICRHVRAMQPWPTAYTYLHRPGKEPMRVIVSRAHELVIGVRSVSSAIDVPGRVQSPLVEPPAGLYLNPTTHTGLFVATGTTYLHLDELQPAGKKRMTAEEFLRGHPIVEGMRFGPEVLS
jgi:methionyl-tRNA formyltransferase